MAGGELCWTHDGEGKAAASRAELQAQGWGQHPQPSLQDGIPPQPSRAGLREQGQHSQGSCKVRSEHTEQNPQDREGEAALTSPHA